MSVVSFMNRGAQRVDASQLDEDVLKAAGKAESARRLEEAIDHKQ